MSIRCSDCFSDEGLKILAFRIGQLNNEICSSCGSKKGRKLDKPLLVDLADRFFVSGTYIKTTYGGASILNFGEGQKSCITISDHLKDDVKKFEDDLGIGFYYYGPPTWRIGQIEPLNDLLELSSRKTVIDQLFNSYRTVNLLNFHFYRLRVNPKKPDNVNEYDSPPREAINKFGRLDTVDISVLYGAFDIPTCLHECRVAYGDNIYMATLLPKNELKFLDLCEVLSESGTPFESLDMAVSMLFGASSHAYEICQDIALEALRRGFDGIIYPSYFTGLNSGFDRLGTCYELPIRSLPQFRGMLQRQIYPNIAIFGRPITEGKIKVKCINKIHLNRVEYDYGFGPVI